MNRLSNERRAQILTLLTESMGVNSVVRITGTAKTTILRLLAEAGRFSTFYQAHRFRDALHAERIEADEIWSFVGAKRKNARQPGHGNLWTYTAIDPDSKLMAAWAVGERGPVAAHRVMADLADRVAGRIQLTTDAHNSYLEAIRAAFGWRIDYAQLVKDFDGDGPSAIYKRRMIGDPDMRRVSTSIVERANLAMRHRMRRFNRKTMGFSKKGENHAHMVDIHFLIYNFVTPHGTLTERRGKVRTTPAMEAGLESRPWTMLEVAERMDGSYRVAV